MAIGSSTNGGTVLPSINSRETARQNRDALLGGGNLDPGSDMSSRLPLPPAPIAPPPAATAAPRTAPQPTSSGLPVAPNSSNTQAAQPEAELVPDIPVEVTAPRITFATGNSTMDAVLSNQTFVPNALNNYHQPAYHWEFYVTKDEDWLSNIGSGGLQDSVSALDRQPKIVLAESGVTNGFAIKSVNIDAIVSSNNTTRNTNATKFTMELVEPLGTSFMDAVATAARDLGVQNYTKTFYILELVFLGYDETGKPKIIIDGSPNGGKWVWVVQVTNIEVQFDSSGSRYQITMMPVEEKAVTTAELMRTQQFFIIKGATVREFLEDFRKAINDSVNSRYGTMAPPFYEVSGFITDGMVEHPHYNGKIGDIQITPRQPERSPLRNASMSRGENNIPQAQIPMNSAITDVIEWMFLNTEVAQHLVVGRIGQGRQRQAEDRVVDKIVFRVEPEIRVMGYDPVNGQYKYQARYHIHPFYTQRILLQNGEVGAAYTPMGQAALRQALERRNLLKKRYDYIFTGLNTEVIDCDIKFNTVWTASVANMAGAQGRYESAATGAMANGNTQNAQYNRENIEQVNRQQALQATARQIDGNIQRITTTTGSLERSISNAASRIAQIDVKLRDTTLSADERTRLTTERSGLEQQQGTRQTSLREAQGQLSSWRTARVSIANQLNPIVRSTLRAADPTSGRPADVRYAEDTVTRANIGEVLPISFEQSREGAFNSMGLGFEGQYHRSKSAFGAALEQLYADFSANFFTLDISIRGDPYWLGTGNVARLRVLRDNNVGLSRNVGGAAISASYFEGEHHFAFMVKYPYTIASNGSAEGQPVLRDQDQYTGIYAVTNVESTFSDGEFRQRLKAQKLPLIKMLADMTAASNRPAAAQNNRGAVSAPVAPQPASGGTTV